MIDIEEIRKRVAVEHNVLLGKDDPILVTLTLNEMILKGYLQKASEEYENANRGLIASVHQELEAAKEGAKDTAGRMITDASTYVSQQVRQAVDTVLADAGSKLSAAQAAERQAVERNTDAHSARRIAIMAACISGFAAVSTIAAAIIIALVK